MTRLFFAALLLLSGPIANSQNIENLKSAPLNERGKVWICRPIKKFYCTFESCKKLPPTVSLIINFNEQAYERCDKKGCDRYPMKYQASKIFTVINRSSGGADFVKVRNDGRIYIEVVSLGMDTIIYYGTCKKQ